jgi:hypothetical protein
VEAPRLFTEVSTVNQATFPKRALAAYGGHRVFARIPIRLLPWRFTLLLCHEKEPGEKVLFLNDTSQEGRKVQILHLPMQGLPVLETVFFLTRRFLDAFDGGLYLAESQRNLAPDSFQGRPEKNLPKRGLL